MKEPTKGHSADTSQPAVQREAQTGSMLDSMSCLPSAQSALLPRRQAAAPAQQTAQQTAQQATAASQQQPQQFVTRFRPPHNHVGTLYDNWQASIAAHPQVPALGWRATLADGKLGPYQWNTYKEVGDRLTALGSGLLHLGLSPGSMIGLYGVNSKEWVLMDAAAHAYSMITVPLYDTLGPHAVEYICNHAELAAVGCSAAVWPKLQACLPQCSTVRLVVIWGAGGSCPAASIPAQQQYAPSTPLQTSVADEGVHRDHTTAAQQQTVAETAAPEQDIPSQFCQVVSFHQLQAVGQDHLQPHAPPQPQDVATICYTSGTTGDPKGVVLTHANLISNAAGNAELLSPWPPGSRHLSYLPLAHIFERKNLVVAVHYGCSIGFYSGDARRLLEDAAELQPHMFMSVPRIFNRLHDEAVAAAKKLHHGVQQLSSQLDEHSRAALRAGASPISSEVLQFLRAAFCCPVLEGYGMTETSCTISLQRHDDVSVGHVGRPLACCEVMLQDVPELGYLTTDQPQPRGEVCVRGPIIFQGYHKAPHLTAQVIDHDGWFHSGDVGCWVSGGNLKIIDRVKNIFKLAQGEYVAPERLEAVYVRSLLVQQCFVFGDSYKAQLVAVVVPDAEQLTAWTRSQQIHQELHDLCSNTVVEEAVLQSMLQQGRAEQLQGFELVAAVRLVPQPFTVEDGLLTPTLKLRRHAAREKYRQLIDDMYEALERKLQQKQDVVGADGGGGGSGDAVDAGVPGTRYSVARFHTNWSKL